MVKEVSVMETEVFRSCGTALEKSENENFIEVL